MSSITVVQGAQVAASRWDAYVRSHPMGTCFHLEPWRQVVRDSLGHKLRCLAAQDAQGRVVGVLPLAEMKSPLFGHTLTSLPGGVECGVLADDDHIARLLASAAREQGVTSKVSHIELRHRAQQLPDWAQHDSLYFSFRKEIPATPEAALLAIPRKQRAEVRKGIAAGCTFEIDASSDRFYAMYADNVHRHGTPGFSKNHFDTIAARFGKECEFAIVKNAAGKPVSGVMSLYFGEIVFPYYAGDYVEAREISANDFKYYHLMVHAYSRGARWFDFGRSKLDTGPYKFKKYWGFEPVPYHYEFALLNRDEIPQVNPSNPKYAKVIEIWRRLPRALVNRIGHPLARHLC
jgi:FemAB-related protein (PEP-CTERM system-associated)